MKKVTNTRDFPVEVSLSENGEDKKVTLKPGESIELADDQLGAVEKQLADAEAPADDDKDTAGKQAASDEQIEAAKKDNDEDLAAKSDIPPAGEGTENTDGDKPKTEELSETARELAEAKRKLALRDIDDEYNRLLSEGRMVPAMEKPFKELSEALFGQSRELSDGKTESLSEVLARFTSSIPKIVHLDDEKGKDGDAAKKSPWQELDDRQREKLQASGITEESYNANGGRTGISAAELVTSNNKES